MRSWLQPARRIQIPVVVGSSCGQARIDCRWGQVSANGALFCKAECDVITKKAGAWLETEVGASCSLPKSTSSVTEKDPDDPIKRRTDPDTGITYEERDIIWEDVLTADATHDPYSIAVSASKKLYLTEILGRVHGSATPGLIQRDGIKRDEIGEDSCNAKIEVAKRAE